FITNGTSYNLRSNPERYSFYKNCGGDITGDQGRSCELVHKFIQADRQAETKYTIDIEDYRKGFLSYINISPFDTDESYKLEIRNRISNQNMTGSEYKAKFNYQNSDGEHRNYEIFVDNVYGTFAVQDPSKVAPIIPDTKGGKKPTHVKNNKQNN
ncbi:MAG: hypothetical protein ABIN74_11090, partial [Ferruginibacter sp.]